jgi:glycosyltransferase involved in cell wall biosynthesis
MYTVVMASRAGEPRIRQALASIFQQTLPPYGVEILIDHCDPPPPGWAEALCCDFPGTQVVLHPGRGLAAALTAGIKRVQTPLVAFLDSDDEWMPDKQRIQVDRLDEDSTLDAVTCRSVNVHIGRPGLLSQKPVEAAMFTATTFRTTAFEKFGPPDDAASHFVWLYRWWSNARANGIRTSAIDYVGLQRVIDGRNSWIREGEQAHSDLLAELRRTIASRREAHD